MLAQHSHAAIPLGLVIVLAVLVGALGFWLVAWAIPKFLTGQSGFQGLPRRGDPIWVYLRKKRQAKREQQQRRGAA